MTSSLSCQQMRALMRYGPPVAPILTADRAVVQPSWRQTAESYEIGRKTSSIIWAVDADDDDDDAFELLLLNLGMVDSNALAAGGVESR